ncbi:hypothetical protein FKM82_025569 [Ascaphus truei]
MVRVTDSSYYFHMKGDGTTRGQRSVRQRREEKDCMQKVLDGGCEGGPWPQQQRVSGGACHRGMTRKSITTSSVKAKIGGMNLQGWCCKEPGQENETKETMLTLE